ncbi:MAG TPA: glycoside hydrolase family 88 protein [Thermoanaerobaculia bacterium]|nr:glycoside hydrolase family 88 protein [Thermoanaerobaculia bacterium]
MPRSSLVLVLALSLLVSLPAAAKRRAVQPPVPLTREALSAVAAKVAARAAWAHAPRLHWENAVLFDGFVLAGEQMNLHQPGSGDALIARAASVLLDSDDDIAGVSWADGTAYAQAALDLYRVLPPSDPRRERLLGLLDGPMRFAGHAVRATPPEAAPRDPWWIPGGYGARFWQDDLYMVVPWLSLYGSTRHGLPGNELARNLAYEWIEAYVHEHRPESGEPVPSLRARRGALLWSEEHALFRHEPNHADEFFWARGNGWALVALARAAEALDAPYTGGRYDQVVGAGELREMLRASAESLLARQGGDGGWSSYLARPEECPDAETSGTALLTFFLARGVNEGWLDRDVYTPAILRATSLLVRRVDAQGDVIGIQPPDIGPNCGKIGSDNGRVNVNHGPGALLLALSEVMKM